MKRIIVDSSLAVKWRIDEELADKARFMFSVWKSTGVEILVPSWFACEIANVYFQRHRRKIIEVTGIQDALAEIFEVVSIAETGGLLGLRAVVIAAQTRQKASYDAFYLALAEHLECDLWTADERFWESTYEHHPSVKWLGNVVVVPPGN